MSEEAANHGCDEEKVEKRKWNGWLYGSVSAGRAKYQKTDTQIQSQIQRQRQTIIIINIHALLSPCAENDIINVLDEPYFGTHILSNSLPFQTFEIPKKNTQPLISIRGLAFNVLLRSSEKWKFQDTALESVWDKHSSE